MQCFLFFVFSFRLVWFARPTNAIWLYAEMLLTIHKLFVCLIFTIYYVVILYLLCFFLFAAHFRLSFGAAHGVYWAANAAHGLPWQLKPSKKDFQSFSINFVCPGQKHVFKVFINFVCQKKNNNMACLQIDSLKGSGVTRLQGGLILLHGALVREDLWISDGHIVDAQHRFFNVRLHSIRLFRCDVDDDGDGFHVSGC
jgi:hypothetical protein